MKKFILFGSVFISLFSCKQSNKQQLSTEVVKEMADQAELSAQNKDSIYSMPQTTPVLKNSDFINENKKYKDWPKEDSKMVVLKTISHIDGTISDAKILRSSGVDKLDEEALWLVGIMELEPAKNEFNESVNSYYTFTISFP